MAASVWPDASCASRLPELRHPAVEAVGARALDHVVELRDRLPSAVRARRARPRGDSAPGCRPAYPDRRRPLPSASAARRSASAPRSRTFPSRQCDAAAGASPGLVVGGDGHHCGVQHDHRLREQVLPLRLLAVAIREEAEDRPRQSRRTATSAVVRWRPFSWKNRACAATIRATSFSFSSRRCFVFISTQGGLAGGVSDSWPTTSYDFRLR